jgi:hypothetical protein
VTRALRLAIVLGAAAVLAGSAVPQRALAAGEAADAQSAEPTWDRPATIRAAAERLGVLHRTKGAKAAYELIENCYKTHSLAETYGEGFEICIAQDYLETRTLMLVYSRMPPEALQKMGVPSPQELADGMGARIAAAFRQYNKDQAYADGLKRMVDDYGVPVFLSLVFPDAAKSIGEKEKQLQEKRKPQ